MNEKADISHHEYLGTRLNPDPAHVRNIVSSLISQARGVMDSGSIVQAHNTYVMYTTTLLLAATSHRPVLDPFPYRYHLETSVGLALMSDKVPTEGHRWRISALPSIACRSVSAYDAHLRGMAAQIRRVKPGALSDELLALAHFNQRPSIPYLFLLDDDLTRTFSISQETISTYLNPFTELPPNLFRHILATWAEAHDIESELVETHLGHQSSLHHPFGKNSVRSPIEFARQLSPALDCWLKELGWQVLEGIRERPRVRPIMPAKKRIIAQVHENNLFGPELREQIRATARSKDKIIILEALKGFAGLFEKKQITEDEAENIQARIVELSASDPARADRRIKLFWRYLLWLQRMMYRQGRKSPEATIYKLPQLPPRLSVLMPEPSPFNNTTVLDYTQAMNFRTGFIDYIRNREKQTFTPGRRIAEIVVSAAVFGYMPEKNLIALPQLVWGRDYHVVEDVVIIDFPRPDVTCASQMPDARWIADTLTRGLLWGLEASSGERDTNQVPSTIKKELQALCGELGRLEKSDTPYESLAKLGKALRV